MSNQEKAAQINRQPSKGKVLKHTLKVVSGLSTNNEVGIVEKVVHFGHQGEIPNMHRIAVESLESAGRSVDTYNRSEVVDLERFRRDGVVGEYQRGEDTFVYTEVIYERGHQRVETVAFTSKTQQQVRANLGEPDVQEERAVQLPTIENRAA